MILSQAGLEIGAVARTRVYTPGTSAGTESVKCPTLLPVDWTGFTSLQWGDERSR